MARSSSIRDYAGHRILTSGVRPFVRLLENGADALDPLGHQNSAIRAMRDAAAARIGIVNDIFSADREEASGYHHNAVLIIQRTTGCDRAAAIAGAAKLANEYMDKFRSAHSVLLEQYARRCRVMMRGSFDWHLEVQRYGHHRSIMTLVRGRAQQTAILPGVTGSMGSMT